MTPDRFCECLQLCHWGHRQFGRILDVHFSFVRNWADGSYAVPDRLAIWLEATAQFHARHPAPDCSQDMRQPDVISLDDVELTG